MNSNLNIIVCKYFQTLVIKNHAYYSNWAILRFFPENLLYYGSMDGCSPGKTVIFHFMIWFQKFLSCIFSELHLTYVWVKRRWSLKISHRQTEPSVELVVSNYFQIESSSLILLQKWVCIPPLYEKQFLKLINIHNARQDIQKYCTENHLQTKQYDKKQDFS